MPVTIETAVSKLKVPERIASVVVPLGATINMAGTALYQAIAVMFLAQIAGVDLSGGDLALIVITLVAASIGAPGTPGISIVILSTVVAGFGIPTTGLILILGVDRILDMSRTVVNVTGDLTACVLIRGSGKAPAKTASPQPAAG
jgi:Na+/H+-dicarboxylate symporter